MDLGCNSLMLKVHSIKIEFGFNKEGYVFINRRSLYNRKNEEGTRYQKIGVVEWRYQIIL